ncbi:Hypothetical predicted protein [Lecanosticta acicola]|uniref:Uncharacterized protein n=1 Tax=Lecanosticta acicola TaxID=111012 RepID=A0AAI9EAR8_9PEZI|nr:Hypothetical predicted protein [Lecanosticta acicola]
MLSLILAVVSLAASRAAADGAEYFVYGAGSMKGQPLFYTDGGAYVGTTGPPDAGLIINITLVSQNVSDGSFTANPVNGSAAVTGNWTSPKLYINNNSGSFDAVGFTSDANTTITTTGFKQWGSRLVWVSDAGDLVSKWYAEPVNEENTTYILKWNVDNVSTDSAIPVVVKNTSPDLKAR